MIRLQTGSKAAGAKDVAATQVGGIDSGRVPYDVAAPPIVPVSFAEFGRDLFRNMRRLQARHGPIAAIEDGNQRAVFLFSPEYNQQVLSDVETYHARFFAIRGPKRSSQRRLTCGLLAMNGEQHRRNRRMVKEPFSLRAIATYGDTVARQTDDMLQTWKSGGEIDLAAEMRRLLLRMTSTILFGLDEPEKANHIGDMLARWVHMNHTVGTGALVPDDVFSAQYEDLLGFAEALESQILGMIARRRKSTNQANDVLSILVRSFDEEGGLSDEELVGQAAVLFGAAHMTTAHSLTWTLLLLAQHPETCHRLYAELQAGDSSSAPRAPADPAHSLLERVIKESMRVLPASAYSQRVNMKAVRIGPLDLARGTAIVFTPLVVHHLPELYEQPECFEPDRWLTLRPSPYAYFPFGGGPRMCIGGPLAMAILRTVIPRILLRHRLTVVPEIQVDAQVESTMLGPVADIPMEVHPPDGQFCSGPITGNIHELVHLE